VNGVVLSVDIVMFTKGKTFLFLVILAGITLAATLRLTLHSAVDPVPEKGGRFTIIPVIQTNNCKAQL
jgi:hypothetical protein